jgi:histidyl-tRNA synthetase
MQKGPVTPKGFSDIMPEEARKRRFMINAIVPVLEKYGFVPIETPTVEFAETLLGKYGEDEKLVYTFEDKGGRKLALRYDLTVPLARFVANNLGLLKPTFSRYQIGQLFRADNPQRGRRREFTQLDFDTVGSSDFREDAKVIAAAIEGCRAIGLNKAYIQINDRRLFDKLGITQDQVRTIDKIEKIGKEEVEKIVGKDVMDKLSKEAKTERLSQIFAELEKNGFEEGKDFVFNPYLARGLDYYTSTVYELKLNKEEKLTIGGGGRYDNLIGMFAGRTIPAVGFSFGIDRIIDLLDISSS